MILDTSVHFDSQMQCVEALNAIDLSYFATVYRARFEVRYVLVSFDLGLSSAVTDVKSTNIKVKTSPPTK